MRNPLENCSEDLRSLLLAAGWRPGVSRTKRAWWQFFAKTLDIKEFNRQYEKQFSQYPDHCARRVVDELYGILLETFQINRFYAIDFDPRIGMHCSDEIMRLGEILNECLVPIGETPSEAVALLGATGNIYLMGVVASGVFSLGYFDDAIFAAITGQGWQLLEFDSETDPTGEFSLR